MPIIDLGARLISVLVCFGRILREPTTVRCNFPVESLAVRLLSRIIMDPSYLYLKQHIPFQSRSSLVTGLSHTIMSSTSQLNQAEFHHSALICQCSHAVIFSYNHILM